MLKNEEKVDNYNKQLQFSTMCPVEKNVARAKELSLT